MNDKSLLGFERLASQATVEPPLRLDVANRVLNTLHSRTVTRAVERDIVMFGGASMIAASMAIAVWLGAADEILLPMIQPFVTVLQ